MEIPDKVMVLGFGEASTEGRVSIPMYAELKGSQFLENLEYWHLFHRGGKVIIQGRRVIW